MRANIQLIGECPLYLAPLDTDLLTMSKPAVFRDCVLHGDPTALYQCAQAVMQLQVCSMVTFMTSFVHHLVLCSLCTAPFRVLSAKATLPR